ncbi:hypothetical protein [Cupriavidus necator]
MKKGFMVAVLSAAVLSVMPAFAQEGKPVTKSAPPRQEQPNVAEFDKQAQQIQENMRKMQEQMGIIQKTQDPQERQKLLQGHWTTMQDTMGMMHGLWGPGAMGKGVMGGPMMGGHTMGGRMMGWGQMGDYYSKLTPEQMKQRQYMMDQYLGMQQMMMNNIMQHQYMRMQPQPPRQP